MKKNIYQHLLLCILGFIVLNLIPLNAQENKDTNKVRQELSVEADDLSMFGVSISPNPAEDFIFITLDPDLFRGNIDVTISNVKGKEDFKKRYKAKNLKKNKIRIDVKEFRKGIYKVTIETLEVELDLHFIKS